jgi:uridine phosphorylase
MAILTPADFLDEPAVINAAAALQARGLPGGAPPAGVILCYQPALLRYAIGPRLFRRLRARAVRGFHAAFYTLRATGHQVGVAGGFGVGGPAVGVLVEELAAWGVQRVVTVGLAGGLQLQQRSGDLLLATAADRNDGVSDHYLPPGAPALADNGLTGALAESLQRAGRPFSRGPVWTTAAPYRETASQVAGRREAGALAVDMEAAALFAVGQARGTATACLLVIADHVRDAGWALDVDAARCATTLQRAFDAALAVLSA